MIPQLYELVEYSLSKMGLPVIWSYQNAPRHPKPYIMLNYTNVDMPDHSHYTEINDHGIRINSAHREVTAELQFYAGAESYQFASRAVSYLVSEESLLQQQRLDVAIGPRLFLQRVPAILNESQWEDRAIYQFMFYYTERFEDDVGIIEGVEVEGEYSGALHPLKCKHLITWMEPTEWDDSETIWDDGETFWDGFRI